MLGLALKYKFNYISTLRNVDFSHLDELRDQKRVHRRQPCHQIVLRSSQLPVESDADVLRGRHKNRQLHGRCVDIRLQKTARQIVETLTFR